MNFSQAFTRVFQQLQTFEGWARLIVTLCTVAVLTAVFINFRLARGSRQIRARRNSFVETGSMLAFFVGFYLLIRFRIGVSMLPELYYPLATIGLLLVVVGAIVNIIGRFALGRNWGNQVIIYEDHTLVTGGIYRAVRHPLYASLIWMFVGAALAFQNWAALTATVLLFIPGMRYRGAQEEKALLSRFPEYETYRRRTGMFFPLAQRGETVEVPRPAFAFCRLSLTGLLWVALFLNSSALVLFVLFLLILSAISGAQFSPMIQLYQQTMLRIFPAKHFELLDVSAMRFAHGSGAVMCAVVGILMLTIPNAGWYALMALCGLKTISALGFCPASKLFVCMRNGGCCALTRRHP